MDISCTAMFLLWHQTDIKGKNFESSQTANSFVGFEVLTEAVKKSIIIWKTA
jgi:hypothetical protein